MKPLIDGHGRPIGDVRISVTDRCNFRCQYCMPAEGLPWLKRDSLLSYEEVARLVALLSSMGVHDVRLTGGEPLVRKELWRLVEMLSGIEDVHDLSLTTNGYLLEAQVGDLVRAGLKRINVSLDSLAPDRFFQLTRRDSLAQVLEGLEAAESHPELRPIKVNVVALKDFTEDEVVRFADFARRTPYVVRFIEFMPLDADRSWSADKVLPNEEIRRLINEVLSARGRRPRAPRHLAALALRRRAGRDRLHLPRHRVLLRRLQPHPPDRRGDAAHLPLLAQRDRPAHAHARGRERRGDRGDRPRRRLAQGAQAPHRRRGLRAAGALDVADRRVKCLPEDAALVLAAAAPLATERVPLPRRPGASPPRRAVRRRHAAVRPLGDGRLRDALGRHAAGPLRLAGEVAAGETSTATLEPGTAMGIFTGAAIPPGADAVLQRARRGRERQRASDQAIPVGSTSAVRGEDVHAGDLIAPAGEPLTLARVSSLAAAGVAELPVHRRPRVRSSPPATSCPARRAARAGPDPRVQRAAVRLLAGARART